MFKHLKYYIFSLYEFSVVTDCSWGSWGAWSGCNSKCTRYRVREMAEERQFGGSACNGLRKETALCQQQKCGGKAFYRAIFSRNH